MELWIRSQDGERLTTCRDFRIYYAKVDDVWVIEDCDDLAAYKTKERALQILDEIQNILQPKVIYKDPEIDYNDDNIIQQLSSNILLHSTQQVEMELKQAGQIVYQMPKE